MLRRTADGRTLPLHVTPVSGEALDSWLEAIAHRHDTPFGTLLQRCGMHHQALCGDWMLVSEQRRFEHLGRITGVEPSTLVAMTLARYGGLGMNLGGRGMRARPTPWGWKAMSRYCPQCLHDTEGRWQIAWRLNWSFACPRHHRLLADRCPECKGQQRWRVHSTLRVPWPGHCALTRRESINGASVPCHADLATVGTQTFEDGAPIIEAQRRIDELLMGRPIDFPLFQESQPHPRDALRDIMLIARWAAGHAPATQLGIQLPTDVTRVAGGQPTAASTQRLQGNPGVTEVATGVATAIEVLNAPDVSRAAGLLRQVLTSTGGVAIPAASGLSPIVRTAYDQMRHLASHT